MRNPYWRPLPLQATIQPLASLVSTGSATLVVNPTIRHVVAALLALGLAVRAQIPAFPGAEGYGSHATGGRGGDVYVVTNLNASGAGSFADAVATAPTNGRTIMFAVSGHIRLPSGSGGGLSIAKSKITVAGQTAPGDGICFWNNTMNLTGDDLVIRHVRWRFGKQAAGGDAVDINGSQRVILDHCEVMFSTDENLSSFGSPPEYFTFQWSINAWGLQSHSCGGLWDINHATAHHTLWANNHTRNPKCIAPAVFDWVNNIVFGWDLGFNMAASGDLINRVNIRGSTFSHGGSAGDCIYGGGNNPDGSRIFKLHVDDSALDGNNNGVLDVSKSNYEMVSSGTTYDAVATAWPQTVDGILGGTAIGAPVTLDARLTAYKKVLSQAGTTRMEISARPLRDEITQLCVDRVAALQRGIIADPLELGLSTGTAFAVLNSTTAPTDTDRDGMPDYWESALGLSTTLADNNTVLTAPQLAASYFPAGSPVGYTQIEEYLHFKAVPHGTVARNVAASPSFIDMDLRKFTSGFTDSPVFTVSNVSGGTTTQSGPGGAVVRFTPTADTSGRAKFLFTVTDAAGSTWTQQCCLLVSTKPAPREVTWVGDAATNNWNTTTANFSSLLGPTPFAGGDAVTIDDTGSNAPTIKVNSAFMIADLTVANSAKAFTIEGTGSLSGTGGLTKTGTGTLTMKVNHTSTGPGLIDGGAVVLGGTSNAGTLPSGALTLQNDATITNAWPTSSSTQNISASLFIPTGHAATIQTGRRIWLSGALTGGGDLNIVHQGTDGIVELRGAMNAFAGNLNVTFTGTNGATKAVFNGASFNGMGAANVTFPAGITLSCTTNSTGNTFAIGALNGAGTLGGGSSGSPNYTVGALNTDTTFAGGFSGNAKLTKVGTGKLTLTGTSNHTAATAVSTGELAMNGIFGTSPVTVANDARLTGTGTFGGTVGTSAGGIIAPGNGGAGTMNVASLALTAPELEFDLSNNPAGANDRIVATGAATLTNAQNFAFHLTNGNLGAGTYDLITTTGAVTGANVAFSSNLPTGSRQTLTLERSADGVAPGYVRLVVAGASGNLTWTGTNGGIWDQQTTSAWSGATPATFFNFDNVTFTDTATSGMVSIAGPVAPQSITVNNTAARPYTFSGGPITGSAALVKNGTGTLTLNLPQSTLTCGTTLDSAIITTASTAGLVPGMNVVGAQFPAGTVIETVGVGSVTLSQNATATNAAASLVFETRHTFTGGTVINAGTVILTSNAVPVGGSISAPANPFGLGTGPVTLAGGTLTLQGHTGGAGYLDVFYGGLPNDLIVPAGANATLQNTVRGSSSVPFSSLSGALTGAGTLNLVVNYYRSAITGDWSAFAGTLLVKRPASGANDPRFQLANEAGLPLATVHLEQVRLDYTAVPDTAGAVVPIGSLSGISTAVISGGQSSTAPVTWRVGGLNTNATFAGSLTPFTGGGGPIGLAKTGTGTWTLTGSGTVSGGITVEDGTLSYGDAAGDTLAGTSAITVQTGGTLQLNSGATLTGASLDIAVGGTFRGRGNVNADVSSGGAMSVLGGTLAITGDVFLGGSVTFSSLTDRLAVTGALGLEGQINLPTGGLSFGRKLLMTYTGALTLGAVNFGTLPAGYFAVLDTGTVGEIAAQLIDHAAYQTWQTTNFGNTTNPLGQPLADADGDGMTNLEEWEAGTNPNSAASAIALVWAGNAANTWDHAITATWLENTRPRVFRNLRQVIINDTGSNAPIMDLRGSLAPSSLSVANSTKAFTLNGSGSLDGAMTLTKSGTSTLTLLTANNFTGATTISAGVVNIQTPEALGGIVGGTTVANNARLELQGGITTLAESLTISGLGGASFFNGALNSKSGVNTWTGPVTIAAAGTRIGAQAAATLIVSGVIDSSGQNFGLIVRPNDPTASVILAGASTYVGDTTIIGGPLRLDGGNDRLPIGTTVKLGASNVSGSLDLNGRSQRVAGIAVVSGTANAITSATGGTLTVANSTTQTYTGALTGSLGLTKTAAGTLILSGTTTFTGPTFVDAGTLRITSTLAGTSGVTIASGATFTSTGGSITGEFNNAGSATISGGTLSVTGNITNSGTLRVTGGGQLVTGGTFSNSGILDLLTSASGLPANLSNTGIVILNSERRILTAVRNGANFTVTVTGYTGHTYQLQGAVSPGGPWTNIGAALPGTGTTLTLTDTGGATGSARFYRVHVSP